MHCLHSLPIQLVNCFVKGCPPETTVSIGQSSPMSSCRKLIKHFYHTEYSNIVSEYDQEIPQSQTADNPKAPRGRATQLSRDTRETN